MLEKIKKYSIAGIVASLILGIIFIVNPTGSTRTIAYILGVVIIASGIYDFVMYFNGIGYTLFNRYNLLTAIFKVLVGLVIVTHIDFTVNMFGFFFALYIISSSVNTFEESIVLKRVGASGWLVSLILSVIVIIMGVSMVFVPFEAADTAATFAGIILITDAISGTIAYVKVKEIKQEVLDSIDNK